MVRMYRYSEDGRSFIMVDGRDVAVPRFRSPRTVHELCLVHSADGIAVLDRSEIADFSLSFLGSDGAPHKAEGPEDAGCRTLAGAALCSVAFADLVGVKAFHSTDYTLEISGRVYAAQILSHLGECKVVTLAGPGMSVSGSTLCEGEFE